MENPTAPKPISIIAQVAGSGTAAVTAKFEVSNALITGLLVKVAEEMRWPPVPENCTYWDTL